MSTKPVILIVPGSFCTPEFYTSTSTYLKNAGYETETISLPSVGGSVPKTMQDDAAHIQSIASKYCDQGKDVVIVMHAYGGIPGTESSKGMSKVDREAAGKKAGVVGLVYIAALLCPIGMSLKGIMGEGFPEFISVKDNFMTFNDLSIATKQNFSDIPFEEGLAWTKKISHHHSYLSFEGELTYAGYKDIPTTYIHTEQDVTLPTQGQYAMVEAAGVQIRQLKLESGHFPSISQPEKLGEVLIEATRGP